MQCLPGPAQTGLSLDRDTRDPRLAPVGKTIFLCVPILPQTPASLRLDSTKACDSSVLHQLEKCAAAIYQRAGEETADSHEPAQP